MSTTTVDPSQLCQQIIVGSFSLHLHRRSRASTCRDFILKLGRFTANVPTPLAITPFQRMPTRLSSSCLPAWAPRARRVFTYFPITWPRAHPGCNSHLANPSIYASDPSHRLVDRRADFRHAHCAAAALAQRSALHSPPGQLRKEPPHHYAGITQHPQRCYRLASAPDAIIPPSSK